MSRNTGIAYIDTASAGAGYNMKLTKARLTPSFLGLRNSLNERGLLYFAGYFS